MYACAPVSRCLVLLQRRVSAAAAKGSGCRGDDSAAGHSLTQQRRSKPCSSIHELCSSTHGLCSGTCKPCNGTSGPCSSTCKPCTARLTLPQLGRRDPCSMQCSSTKLHTQWPFASEPMSANGDAMLDRRRQGAKGRGPLKCGRAWETRTRRNALARVGSKWCRRPTSLRNYAIALLQQCSSAVAKPSRGIWGCLSRRGTMRCWLG